MFVGLRTCKQKEFKIACYRPYGLAYVKGKNALHKLHNPQHDYVKMMKHQKYI